MCKIKRKKPSLQVDHETLPRLIQVVMMTREMELDCEECFDHVGIFAEMVLQGVDAAEVLPLVQDHLDSCSACREEFEGLLLALETVEE